MGDKIPDLSDWLQFLEAKETSSTAYIIGIATLFISVVIGIPVFLSYSKNAYISMIVFIIITSLWIIILGKIIRIGKELKRSRKLLDKILRYNITNVYDIRNEWFKDERR